MGEARRRASEIDELQEKIKLTPRERAKTFSLVHHRRFEETGADGVVFARNVFRIEDENGSTLLEETPDGPRPVLLMSVPQPVRQSVATTIARIG